MKIYLPLLVSLAFFSSEFAYSQVYRHEFQYDQQVKVTVNSRELKSAWAGGMNHPQFAQADLNHDGLTDMVVYENFKGYTVNGLKTFINMGTAGSPEYVYNPDYEYLFPYVMMYMKLIDYNGDQVPDLFHYGGTGVWVCDGFYNNQNRLTFRNCREVQQTYATGKTNIPVLNGDIPGIADVDNDGDLDIILYDISDNDLLQLYKNMCVEEGLPIGDFKMKLKENCWGKTSPTYYLNRQHKLGISCMNVPFAPPGGGGQYSAAKTTGAGNHCITVMDMDGDGDYDFFDGYLAYGELQLVINGKNDIGYPIDSMIAQDTTWPSGGVKVDMPHLPVAYPVDADLDGSIDLLVSPYVDNSEDVNCVAYYKNTGGGSSPYVFQADDYIVKDVLDAGTNAYPLFYDFDRDGKKDLMIGSSRYNKATQTNVTHLSLYKNTGTGGNVSFELVTDNVANVSAQSYGSIAPVIGDIDNDGLDELIVGKQDGTIALFRNYAVNGTLPPVWQLSIANLTTKTGTPIDVNEYAAPCLYDIDKDGKPDLVVGSSGGYLSYYHNEGTQPQEIKFSEVTDKLGDVFVGTRMGVYEYPGYSAPYIGRIDNTQKDYLLVGNNLGGVARYGDIDKPYTTGIVYPRLDSIYSSIVVNGMNAAPAVANLDGDTAMREMYVGNNLGGVVYFRQIFKEDVPEVQNTTGHSRLNVYPNPATTQLHLSFDADIQEAAAIVIYNATGQVVQKSYIDSGKKTATVNIEKLPEGVYLCNVLMNGKHYSSVFVKK